MITGPAKDHVEELQPSDRTKPYAALPDRKIPSLEQGKAEVAREVGMIKIMGVADSGGQHRNTRPQPLMRREVHHGASKVEAKKLAKGCTWLARIRFGRMREGDNARFQGEPHSRWRLGSVPKHGKGTIPPAHHIGAVEGQGLLHALCAHEPLEIAVSINEIGRGTPDAIDVEGRKDPGSTASSNWARCRRPLSSTAQASGGTRWGMGSRS